MLIETLMEIHQANRAVDLERLANPTKVEGDFTGSVTGYWLRLDEDGTGVVKYNSKEYKTVILGIASIPAGTPVELSYADGRYYSKF